MLNLFFCGGGGGGGAVMIRLHFRLLAAVFINCYIFISKDKLAFSGFILIVDRLSLTARNVAYGEQEIENTMLMSFDMKFIRRDQKTRGMARLCRAILRYLVKPDKLHNKTHLHVVFYLSCNKFLLFNRIYENFVRTL